MAYTQVQFEDNDVNEVAVDTSGYTGNFHREKVDLKTLKNLGFIELVDIIRGNNCMLDIMRRIKEIDRDFNGYVTSTELDDIIRLSYGKKLVGMNLMQIFKKYASIQNQILIDYRTFRDDILKQLKVTPPAESDKKTQIIGLLVKKMERS